jgi:colicin import membrane protein
MTEPDGADELVGGTVRVAVTVAALAGEHLARQREERARQAQALNEQQARELQARIAAEAAAARASLASVHRDEWWATAEVADIAAAWETAVAWRGEDPEIDRAADRIRTEVRNRCGVDVDDPQADPADPRSALVERQLTQNESQRHEARASSEATEAGVLMATANAADRAQDNAHSYDSLERRAEFAAAVATIADPETTEAQVLNDLYQGRPAGDAVAAVGQAPGARRTRSGAGLGQFQQRAR